jgi:hypothetical protein
MIVEKVRKENEKEKREKEKRERKETRRRERGYHTVSLETLHFDKRAIRLDACNLASIDSVQLCKRVRIRSLFIKD